MRIDRNLSSYNYTASTVKKDEIKQTKLLDEGIKTQDQDKVLIDDKHSVEVTLEALKAQFPGMDIQIKDLSDISAIKEHAQSHYGNYQLIISPEVLKKLNTDKEFRKQFELSISNARQEISNRIEKLIRSGKAVLGSGIVVNEDGSLSQWVASKKIKPDNPFSSTTDKKESSSYTSTRYQTDGMTTKIKTKDGSTITITKKLSYRPAKDLARLARAGNQQMVKSTMSGIQGQIYQLKTSKGDKQTIRQLVGQAEQVLMKAKIKIKHLKKEELLESMQKKAEYKAQLKKALYLKRTLEENRSKRKTREYGQIRDYYPTPIERQREKEEDKMERELAAAGAGGISQGFQSYCSVAGDISVSDVGISQGSTGVFVDISL